MSQWPPNDPSPQPRDPSPQPRDPSPAPPPPQPPDPPNPYATPAPPAAPPVYEQPAPAAPTPPTPPPVYERPEDVPSQSYDDYEPPAYEPAPPDTDAYSEPSAVLTESEAGDDDIDETVFELNDLSAEQRRHLGMRLTGAGIVFRWEVGSDLVVNTPDADVVETFLDEVENPDAFDATELEAFDDDVDDEVVYRAMSNLYVAADKLQHNADDAATAGSFHLAADGVAEVPPPFGFDPRLWAQVKAMAASITAALDADAEPEAIAAEAHNLRQILSNYV